MAKKFDVIIIGSGPGGYVAASRLSKDKKVAIIEASHLGGTCLNRGCIPTKALLHSSEIVHSISHAKDHGIATGKVTIDMNKMISRKNEVVKKLRTGIAGMMKAGKVEVFNGTGKFMGTNNVTITAADGATETIEADNIIIATGTEPFIPGFLPQDRKKVITSDELLDLTDVPKSIVVVGGGVIGCEFATMLSELGSKVTVVEMADRILPMADKDISRGLTKEFKSRGIDVFAGVAVDAMNETKKGVSTKLNNGETLETSLALVCIGRRPLTENLGLATAGVKCEKGFVEINENCRTNIGNIYAIGDVTGKVQLAHVAYRQAAVAANTILGNPETENYNIVPAAIYTHPEIAWVGLNEEEAKAKGIKIKKASTHMMTNGLALAYEATNGFVKILANEDDEIIGAHIMAPHASDAIQEVAVLMKSECTIYELEATIHGHPTFVESIADAASKLLGKGGH